MLLRQFRLNLFKILLFIIFCLLFYKLHTILHFNKLKINTLFLFNNDREIDEINDEIDMKARNLLVVPEKLHRHLKDVINNSLFLQQGPFKLPSNGDMIHGSVSFEIIPSKITKNNDRIWSQMRYVPPHLGKDQSKIAKKQILLYNGGCNAENSNFNICPVKQCQLTCDKKLRTNVDVILWMGLVRSSKFKRPPGQIWAIYLLESPIHSYGFANFEIDEAHKINWTATYRQDSTIVTPYFKYTPYDLINPPPESYPLPEKNYAAGKTKMVAWFVSNCYAVNDRISVASHLGNYVKVDMYGQCGKLQCPKYPGDQCFKMLNKEYRFYLSFENSNCVDYVTEKFFLNGLSQNVIPIVMGAPPSYYKKISPPHSYIHVEDFKTIKLLANYLKYLAQNDTAYNEYFSWKEYGKVDTNTFFWCRLCMMAHEGDRVKTVINNAFDWWFGSKKRVCIGRQRWSNKQMIRT